jgi:hypothetical protein
VALIFLQLRLCPRQFFGILAERILVVSELFDALVMKIWHREVSAGGITEIITCYFVIMIWRIGFKLAVCIKVKMKKCYIWAGKNKIIR